MLYLNAISGKLSFIQPASRKQPRLRIPTLRKKTPFMKQRKLSFIQKITTKLLAFNLQIVKFMKLIPKLPTLRNIEKRENKTENGFLSQNTEDKNKILSRRK